MAGGGVSIPSGRWPGRGERAAPGLSALLLSFCYPPVHPLILPFVALVPLVLWTVDRPESPEGGRSAARGGLLFGALYFGLLFHWVPVVLRARPLVALGGFLVIAVSFAVLSSLAVGLLHRLVTRVGAPVWLALPVVWTALEWVRANLPSTLALPWLGLGTTLTGFPLLVGIAEIVGARGVTFWIAGVNGLVAHAWLRRREGRPFGTWAVTAAVVLLLPMAWGIWRAGSLETRPVLRVGVAQTVHRRTEADPERGAPVAPPSEVMDALDRILDGVSPDELDLVVLPEALVRLDTREASSQAVVDRIRAHSRELGAPILFGALSDGSAGEGLLVNSAYLMGPQGLTAFRYDKEHLVPVIERPPFLTDRWAEALGAYRSGVDALPARVDQGLLGVLICYESSFAEASRSLRRDGADILINITNDGWLADGWPAGPTAAVWQHPAHLVMRAIETRSGGARAANEGLALFVDPTGRIHRPLERGREGLAVAEVRTTDIVTLYVRYGDLLGVGSAASLLLLLLAGAAGRGGRPAWRSVLSRGRLDP